MIFRFHFWLYQGRMLPLLSCAVLNLHRSHEETQNHISWCNKGQQLYLRSPVHWNKALINTVLKVRRGRNIFISCSCFCSIGLLCTPRIFPWCMQTKHACPYYKANGFTRPLFVHFSFFRGFPAELLVAYPMTLAGTKCVTWWTWFFLDKSQQPSANTSAYSGHVGHFCSVD